jgi:polyisoprenyl-teichoic acid--peptidoglycan teichoic acid transferase
MRLGSVLFKLTIILCGCAALAALGWHLLGRRPFAAAPPVAALPRRASDVGGLAAAVQPTQTDLPAPLNVSIDRIETPPLTNTTNILLAGVDTRPERFGGRTDALVLVVLDERSGHVGLIGVPRDLLVNVPVQDQQGSRVDAAVRINTVYARGTRGGGTAGGRALLKQVLRDVVGLPVHHVVFVNHAGFERLVDAAGGLPVRVICPIRDRFLDPRGAGGRLDLDLSPGVRWMDGRTALMFARSRHGRGAADRARRQQAVLLGLRDRLVQLGVTRARALLPHAQRTVYTDMRAVDLLRLLPWVDRAKRKQIHGLVLHWDHTTPKVMDDGRWVLVPRVEAIAAAVRGLFKAGTPGFRRKAACKPVNAAFEYRRVRDARKTAMTRRKKKSRSKAGE